jgi:hypothetical protein
MAQPPFHVPLIGFDLVIAIAASALSTMPRDTSLRLQLPQRRWIPSQPIPGEYIWRSVVRIGQSLFQKPLGRFAVTRLRSGEVYGLTLGIDSAKQVHPLAGDANERLIPMPSRGFALYLSLQSTIDLRTIGLSPPLNGGVIDRQAPLRHEFLEISQAESESAVPAHTGHDYVRFEFALPEQGRPAGLDDVTLLNPSCNTSQFKRCPADTVF